MKESHLTKQIVQQLLTLTTLTIAISMAIGITIGNWRPGFAQVADWCSQPGILWCSSFEEKDGSNNDVFTYTLNLPTGNSTYAGQYGWYASPGGFVDRNDEQYNAGVDVVAGLPATITKVSTTIPARSGETDVKRFVWFNANTTFAITGTTNKFQYEIDRNAGIFLSRKTEGGGVTLNSQYTQGLYYSSWYYFPINFTSTITANQNLMVMEYMMQSGTDTNNPTWRRPWTIHLQGKAGNKMAFRVDEWSGSLMPTGDSKYNDPVSPRSKAVIVHNTSPLDVPINKWVHLEVFYRYAPYTSEEAMANSWRGKSNGGQVIVFQDGVEIYRFENVATAISTTETLISNHWIVTAYAHKSNPANFNFYVDDSAISTIRLGAARELIRNGDFTSNGNFWRRDNPNGVYSLEDNAGLSVASTKAAKLNIITGTGNLNQPSFYQPIQGGMRPGITYTLRFTGKSTITRTTQVMIYHNGYYPGPFGANNEIEGGDNNIWTPYWYGSCGTVTLSTTVQNFVCPITVSQVVTNGVLGIRVGAYTSTVWLDNISLVENENLLRNGDFEQVAVWNFKNNTVNTIPGASYANDNTGGLSSNSALAAKVSITASGDSSSSVALWQPLSSTLESGITYTLRFSAKVKAGHTRPIRILLQRSGVADGIWTPILLDWKDGHPCGVIQLDENVKNFSCSFQSAVIEAKPIVTFHLGMIDANPNNTWNTDLWIDNVSLARSQ